MTALYKKGTAVVTLRMSNLRLTIVNMTSHAPLLSTAPKTKSAPSQSFISTRRQVAFKKYLPWVNQRKTVNCRPEFSYFPTTGADLQEIICLAGETGKQVRVLGKGLAWSELVPSNDILVYMDQLTEVHMDLSDPDMPLVIVEAGATVRQVNEVLEKHGYALPSNVVQEEASWGGLVATGSFGSGWDQASISDQIQWIDIVDGIGRMRRFEAGVESDDIMDAARLNLGMFGITYRMALRVQKSWKVYVHDSEISLEVALDHMKAMVMDHDNVDFFWRAFNDTVWMKSWDRTDIPVTAKPRLSKWKLALAFLKGHFQWFLSWIGGRFSGLVPMLCRLGWTLESSYGKQVMDITEAIHHRRRWENKHTGCIEIAFPVDDNFEHVKKAFRSVLDQVDTYASRYHQPMDVSVHVRFAAQSTSLLSPAKGQGHSCFLEIRSHSHQNLWEQFSGEIALECLKIEGARPGWGKQFQHIPGIVSHIKDNYQTEIQTFNHIKKDLGMDPDGIFTNTMLKQLFT